MSPRRVSTLFAAAAVVIAAASWLATRGHSDHGAMVGTQVLPELKKSINDVTELRVVKGDGASATLKRQGSEWIVAERGYPADASRVRKLLLDAAALQVVEEKTSNPTLYSALGVEDSGTRLDIVTPAKTWGVIVGRSSGAKAAYLRLQGAKPSLLASPRIEADADPQQWLDKAIANIPEARIQSIALAPHKGPAYVVSRENREQKDFSVSNVPKKRKLSYEGVANSLAGGLESLAMDDVRKPASGEAPAAKTTVEASRATFRTFDGITVELAGRKEIAPGLKPEDPQIEHHYVTLTASSTDPSTQAEAKQLNDRAAGKEFEVSSYKYASLFKPMEELLEAPAEK
jgi:hypothetical protein